MSETSESQNTAENKQNIDDLSDLLGNANGDEDFKREIDKLKSQSKYLKGEKEK